MSNSDIKMRSYFYSGNTPVIDGKSSQSSGVVDASADDRPLDVMWQIVENRMKELGSRSFVLDAFNEVPYVKPVAQLDKE